MQSPDDLSHWVEFFVTVATAAAALTGLIVVGLSINVAYIASSPTHRAHARATLVVLTATMVTGLVGIIPQSIELAGLEFGAVSVSFALINTVNNVRTLRRVNWQVPAAAWRRMAFGYAIAVFGLVGGLSLAVAHGDGGGLYWVALSVISGIIWSIASAWRFLIGVVDEQQTHAPPS